LAQAEHCSTVWWEHIFFPDFHRFNGSATSVFWKRTANCGTATFLINDMETDDINGGYSCAKAHAKDD